MEIHLHRRDTVSAVWMTTFSIVAAIRSVFRYSYLHWQDTAPGQCCRVLEVLVSRWWRHADMETTVTVPTIPTLAVIADFGDRGEDARFGSWFSAEVQGWLQKN